MSAVSGYADDWTMYLGDLSHSSFRPNETAIGPANVAQLQQAWKISVGAPVASGITVSGGALYFGDWSGNFHAVDAATGVERWSQFLGKAPDPQKPACQPRGIGVSAQPVSDGSTIYAAGGDSAVYAMDAGTGTVLWRTALAVPSTGSYLWSSLMISRNALYIGIASLTDCPLVRGGLARIPLDDPSHPQIAYFVPAGQLGAGVWSTPAIDEQNNLVYVTTGNADSQDAQHGVWGSALLALDAVTLQVQSYFFLPVSPQDNDPDWGSSPLLFEAGGQPLVAANGKTGVMYVLQRPSLAMVWSYKLARDCDSPALGCGSISTPAFDGQTLVTGAGQGDGDAPPGMVYAFDLVAQQPIWQFPAPAPVLAPVTIVPGLVFAGTTAGLVALDEASGTQLWTDGGASGGLYGQPVVANGILYAAYVNGDVVAWAPPASIGGTQALSASQTSLKFLYTAGGQAPGPQVVNVSSSGPPIDFQVTSDSAWLAADTASYTTPANLMVGVYTSGLSPGVYNGTLTLMEYGAPAGAITVSLVVDPAPSAVLPASIVNAASLQPGLAPGSLFSIFADSLGAESVSTGAPWLTTMDGITVKINGVVAPLGFISPNQINAQVPFEIAAGTAQITIESNGVIAGPTAATILPAAPGIFTDGNGYAIAVNQDGTPNSPDNPAVSGSVISVYLTGQGPVVPPVATGTGASGETPAVTIATTTATIGGSPASVQFSGLQPGLVGVARVDLTLGSDVPPGDQPVVVSMGGVASNPALISVASATSATPSSRKVAFF